MNGVFIRSASGNAVYGNDIGVAYNGSTPFGNAANGVLLENDAASTTIGSTQGARGNVISGNGGDGVLLQSPLQQTFNADNAINGNSIGVSTDGSVAVANGLNGVEIKDVSGTFVTNNVLSGNSSYGLAIEGPDPITGTAYAAQTTITGNMIGTNAYGTAAVANGSGIYLYQANNNTIGAATQGTLQNPIPSNVISGNRSWGILMMDSSLNLVVNNYIGTDVTGLIPIGNSGEAGLAIRTDGAIDLDGNTIPSQQNTIGGVAGLNSTANVISGNGTAQAPNWGFGVYIAGSTASKNIVEGDYIGVGSDGATVIGNGNDGVFLDGGTSANTIGGAQANAGNVISGNGNPKSIAGTWGYGVGLNITNNNLIQNNTIGFDANKKAAPNKNGGILDGGVNDTWKGLNKNQDGT